ncbi:MAG: hypothetical protein AAGM36_20145 [Cyanobacteria bacterium J06597_1]
MSSRTCMSLLVMAIALSVSRGVRADPLDEVQSCLPEGTENVEVRGEASEDDLTYYYLGADSPQGYILTAISAGTEADCQVLIAADDGETPLHDAMPQQVARELLFENYQLAIQEAGGNEIFETALNEGADGFEIYNVYSEEELWALEELGIAVDPHYTLDATDPNVDEAISAFLASDPQRKYVNSVRLVDDYAIARWILFDLGGVMIGQQVEGEWQVLGFTSADDDPVTPQILQAKFDVPLETARELLGIGG